ncbi:MAG: RNA methyltransferase [Bacteroidota bacterium]
MRSLHEKKNRAETGLFLAEGTKVATELLQSDWKVRELYARERWLDQSAGLLARHPNLDCYPVSEKELSRISAFKSPNEVICVAEMPDAGDPGSPDDGLSLVLDSVRDTGNLGTIIRLADWFGIARIICSPDCADRFNAKVVQATMGSIFRVPVFIADLPELLAAWRQQQPDVALYGAVMQGDNIYEQSLPAQAAIVLGNEAHGISQAVLDQLTHNVTVPAFGGAESLNVGLAAAVICSEFRRPRT